MTDTYKKPGMPSETPEEREFELRAHIGSIWSGGRLFIGMYTFLIASLVFSYFYLRSSNNGNLWRLHDQHAPVAYGWAIYLLILATALLAMYGQRRLRQGGVTDFQVAGWTGFFVDSLHFSSRFGSCTSCHLLRVRVATRRHSWASQ
jgi:hypothetical protein